MYNSYLEYVLDNPVNYDFTKTAGFLDKLIGKGAKAVAEEAKVIPGREFISNPKNADKIRALREDIWRKNFNDANRDNYGYVKGIAKSIRKHSFPNGIADVKPTSVIKNQDGTRTLLYDNPYDLTGGIAPRNDPGYYKNIVYNDLLKKKLFNLADNQWKHGNGLVHNTTFGKLYNTDNNAFAVKVGKPSRLGGGVRGYSGSEMQNPKRLVYDNNPRLHLAEPDYNV